MRVADYIFNFVESIGTKDVFVISGGGNMHLVDALGRNKNLKYWCNHHEQACTIGAEGYSRLSGKLGVALVTTGPGGTNALTGVAGAWLDSIPMLIISGQVKLADTIITNPGLRQFGDQELNIVDMVRPITKYAVTITDKHDIRYHLEKAVHLARTGRPGPVWIDVPLDIQAAPIELPDLKSYPPEVSEKPEISGQINEIISGLRAAKAPILILGNGIRLAGAEKNAETLVQKLGVPFVTSILGKDLMAWDHPLNAGTPGIAGQRGANIVAQNADFILAIGSRLMLRQVGFNYEKFAPTAKKAVVDIDPAELEKKSVNADIKVNADAGVFLKELIARLAAGEPVKADSKWIDYCRNMAGKYNGPDNWHKEQDRKWVNSYLFSDLLSEMLPADMHVVTSNGTAYISPLQVFKQKEGQRLIYNKACASMGYGLPAAMGACIANSAKPVVCMENDGSLQMNIQELQTVVHNKLPLKMVVFNNDGYLSIKITQRNFFPDNICASTPDSGVSCPDLQKVSAAYGIEFIRVSSMAEARSGIEKMLSCSGPVILEAMMDPWQMMYPKISSEKLPDGRMISKPIDDMFPFLSREEYSATKFTEQL